MLNPHKVQSKPTPARGRRDLTPPWLGRLGETSPRHPVLLVPKKPQCTAAEACVWSACVCLRGCGPGRERWRISEGCSLHSDKGGSCGQSPFPYKLLEGKLPLWQYSQPRKRVDCPAFSQLCAMMGKNTQLEPHKGKGSYLLSFSLYL